MLWWAEESSDRAWRYEADCWRSPGDDTDGGYKWWQEDWILWVCNSLHGRIYGVKLSGNKILWLVTKYIYTNTLISSDAKELRNTITKGCIYSEVSINSRHLYNCEEASSLSPVSWHTLPVDLVQLTVWHPKLEFQNLFNINIVNYFFK